MTTRPVLRVLVVDDNPDDYELMRRLLARLASRVEAQRVENGEDMRLALEREPWDLVLVDWIMPRFDAPGALSLLRQFSAPPPCIVVSGMPGEANAVTAIKLGARDFIPKHSLASLCQAVERELLFGKDPVSSAGIG